MIELEKIPIYVLRITHQDLTGHSAKSREHPFHTSKDRICVILIDCLGIDGWAIYQHTQEKICPPHRMRMNIDWLKCVATCHTDPFQPMPGMIRQSGCPRIVRIFLAELRVLYINPPIFLANLPVLIPLGFQRMSRI